MDPTRSVKRFGCLLLKFAGILATIHPSMLCLETPVSATDDTPGATRIVRFEPRQDKGLCTAVAVHDTPLLHTRQFFPVTQGELSLLSAEEQFRNILKQLDQLLQDVRATEIVKLNLYVTSDDVAVQVFKELPSHFTESQQPAVSMIVTRLPVADALVAADAVACGSDNHAAVVSPDSDRATLPQGSRIYVSGQAEQSASLAEATQKTLLSLQKTLTFLGRSNSDIVQLKAFVQPMSDAHVVQAGVKQFFGTQSAPPLVLVEWKSSTTTPIEIELIAGGGPRTPASPSMEFLTPPGMTTSPVYCRVCWIHHRSTIYTSGLFSDHDRTKNPNPEANGDVEVLNVFSALERILKLTDSDFRHLAKATYYVSTEAASASLNRLRPNYYDPERPPAASKAPVNSVGVAGLGLTLDIIAVPNDSSGSP